MDESKESDEAIKEVLNKLSENEMRMTPQRILISKTILSMVKNHVTLKDIYDETEKVLPRVGMSTVYNTIKMLESLGIIDTFYVDGKMRVDRTHPHINIFCKNTQAITDIDGSALEKIREVLKGYGLKIDIKKVVIEANCE